MKKSYEVNSRAAWRWALRGELTIAEIAGRFQNYPNLVQQWKKKLQESASDVFLTKAEPTRWSLLNAFPETIKKYTPGRVDNSYRALTTGFGLDGNRAALWA